MKSSFGQSVEFTLFGESHSDAVGIVINGLAPGIKLDLFYLKEQLSKRRAKGRISTARHEADEPKIVSGYFNGYTTGTPLCIMIENQNTRSGDYEKTKSLPRPSHADYAASFKYNGYEDYRGGGHFSGRLTAPIVAAGAICLQVLRRHGVEIGTHIRSMANVLDTPLSPKEDKLVCQIRRMNEVDFPTLSDSAGKEMQAAIEEAANRGDSLGGVLETAVAGMPAGIGEPFFASVESRLSSLLFSVPAVKGVEFGSGFAIADMLGSQANDSFYMEDGQIKTHTNHNGGINGGVTNGMPIIFRCAVKPTASIYLPQATVNLEARKDAVLRIEGRHDPAIIHRARVVIDSVAAMGLLDLFCERYGYLWMVN